MKLQLLPTAAAAVALAVPADAFTATTPFGVPSTTTAFAPVESRGVRTKSTELYISSWGRGGPPHRRTKKVQDPSKKIQSYLTAPEPVAARSNLDGTVLVSGYVRSKERTDQYVFDLLNHENSAFNFDKIVAFVDDEKFAKKRLLSRSARYTGLLDKLDIMEATEAGALPTMDQLDGVKSWVANVDNDIDTLKKVAQLAKDAPTVENVSVLLTGASNVDVAAATEAIQSITGTSISFSIVAVGEINENDEGATPYEVLEFGTESGVLPGNATFSRDESIRMVTECLGLEAGVNKAFSFNEVTNVNMTAFKLVKGLREAGYTRPQEIDHMLNDGVEKYQTAIDDYKSKQPDNPDEEEWFVRMKREDEEKEKARLEKEKAEKKDAKQTEIEEIAREWGKREYFKQCMSGDMPYTEEEYIESIWDRCLFEGDLKYRMLRGQKSDERKELAEFKEKQAKKKQAMLERAKAELEEIVGEDPMSTPIGGPDEDDKE